MAEKKMPSDEEILERMARLDESDVKLRDAECDLVEAAMRLWRCQPGPGFSSMKQSDRALRLLLRHGF